MQLTNAEEEQSFHAEKFLGSDLKPPKLLRQVPHPDTLAVHSGFVHPVPGGRGGEGGETKGNVIRKVQKGSKQITRVFLPLQERVRRVALFV